MEIHVKKMAQVVRTCRLNLNVGAPSVFAHPVCLNTYRNGTKIGSEAPASYPFVP